MAHDNDNDGVGYGRPPKQHQFKKGQSGNPRGRPKKSGRKPKPGEIDIAAILNGDRTVRTAQGEQRMSGFEILCRAEVMRALRDGDVRAAIRFIKLCETHDVIWTPPQRKTHGVIWYPPGATKEEVERQFWEEKPKRKLKGNKADRAAILEAVAYERHKVAAGKKRYALELVIELVVDKAFAGSHSAARMYEQLSARYDVPAAAGQGAFLLTPGMATTPEQIAAFNKMADEQQRQFREVQEDYEKPQDAAPVERKGPSNRS
jgi:hypothetical protein